MRLFFFTILFTIGLLLPYTTEIAAMESPQTQLNTIEQPLGHKLLITLAGASLISAELWWFLKKPRQK